MTTPPKASVSARDHTRNLKRERILDVAAELFFEKGFHGASMENLCSALGVTKPFIYYHFKSKDEILLALYLASVNSALEVARAARASSDDPVAQLKTFARTYAMLVLTDRQRIALISREKGLLNAEQMRDVTALGRAFLDVLSGLMADGVKAGAFRIDDPALAAHEVNGMIAWAINWYNPSGRRTPQDIADHMEDAALRLVGIATNWPKAEDGPGA